MVQAVHAGEFICGHIDVLRAAPPYVGSAVFGQVFYGRDVDPSQDVLLTILDGRFFPNSVDLSRFMAGANALAFLRHPTLVRTAVVDREADYCVVGYEALPGARTLAQTIVERGTRAPRDVVQRCAGDLARGLAFLHRQNLLHGLLTPACVIEWEGAYVLWQYGLSQYCASDVLVACARTLDGEILAPELFRGERLNSVSDVYGWGTVIARLLTGTPAAESINTVLDEHDFEIAPKLLALLRAALSRDVAQRPRDGVHLLALLDEVHKTVPPPAPRPSPPPPLPHDSVSVLGLDDVELVVPVGDDDPFGQLDDDVTRIVTVANVARGKREDPLESVLGELTSTVAAEPSGPPVVEPIAAVVAHPPVVPPPVIPAVPYRPPRLPGSHGPSAKTMAVLLVGLSAILVLGAGLRVVGGSRDPVVSEVVSARSAELPNAVVMQSTAGDVREPALVAPSEPRGGATGPASSSDTDVACPIGSVPLDERTCIDAAEFPGLHRVPRVGVGVREAADSCEARDGRLCTVSEWQRACGGERSLQFPYGDRLEIERCNTASVLGYAHEVALAGAYAGCVSNRGVHDLVGNVGEWVAEGMAVGGDSSTPAEQATCSAHGRPPKGYVGSDLGFRCCYELRTR